MMVSEYQHLKVGQSTCSHDFSINNMEIASVPKSTGKSQISCYILQLVTMNVKLRTTYRKFWLPGQNLVLSNHLPSAILSITLLSFQQTTKLKRKERKKKLINVIFFKALIKLCLYVFGTS